VPKLGKDKRGSGAQLVDGVTLRRTYHKADAGPPCDVCGFPLVRPLADVGETTHPTCSGEFEDLLHALRRTLARRGAPTGAPSAGVNGAHHQRGLPPKDPTMPAPAGRVPAPADAPPSSPGTMSGRQRGMLFAMFKEAGMTDRALRLEFCTDTVSRPIGSTSELSFNETKQVIDALVRVTDGPPS